ncbi:TniB family NTP-binding protein [Fluviicola taffensis]|uniref:TniB family NTP-binding protein n=1 Tax=Fluviicola taffensis TaxID=191579 RepID=UPI00313823CF
MTQDIQTRIAEIYKPHWINYPTSVQIIAQLNQLLEFPRSHRPQSLLLLSETNNGKTIVAKRFLAAHPPRYKINHEGYEKVIMDILMIQCPHVPDEKRLYFSLMDKLNIAYRASIRTQELSSIVLSAFRRLEIKILILDELQHTLTKAGPSKQREFLNLIKYISNELEICIVGVGNWEAFYVINSDPQLANRFNKAIIPKWKYDNNFISLIGTYQQFIKLEKPFNLVEPQISKRIYDMGEGLLGEYIDIIKLCGEYAIRSGEETITLSTLDAIDYTVPSLRRDASLLED